MAKALGPIEIECDAPPYAIVRACQAIGVAKPEDVAWCRLSAREAKPTRPPGSWSPLAALRAAAGWGPQICLCRTRLPALARHTFEFNTGRRRTYVIGQCPQCRTVYWEEVREPHAGQ